MHSTTLEREEVVHYKLLKLITPEEANRFGVPAESPVFVSPLKSIAENCRECHVSHTPLVYSQDGITEAQHFHPTNGGIYHFSGPGISYFDRENLARLEIAPIYFNGWEARLSIPKGTNPLQVLGQRNAVRSPKVRVIQIRAFCVDSNLHRQYPEIQRGIVYEFTPEFQARAWEWQGRLDPFCLDHLPSDLDVRIARFEFVIKDGTVGFSNL